jgi:hypothetical protein
VINTETKTLKSESMSEQSKPTTVKYNVREGNHPKI